MPGCKFFHFFSFSLPASWTALTLLTCPPFALQGKYNSAIGSTSPSNCTECGLVSVFWVSFPTSNEEASSNFSPHTLYFSYTGKLLQRWLYSSYNLPCREYIFSPIFSLHLLPWALVNSTHTALHCFPDYRIPTVVSLICRAL